MPGVSVARRDRRRGRGLRGAPACSRRPADRSAGQRKAGDSPQPRGGGIRRNCRRTTTAMLRRACHTVTSEEQGADLPVVALVGRPNVGKSTLFGVATGRFAETVNAPGTTLAASRRTVHFPAGDAYLVDLPGTLSLEDSPAGEEPFWHDLMDARPDAILVVGDAGDLRQRGWRRS